MLHRLLGRMNALQAPLINRIHHVALIYCVTAPTTETTYPGLLVSACQLTPTRLRFLVLSASVKPSFLQLHGRTSGRITAFTTGGGRTAR